MASVSEVTPHLVQESISRTVIPSAVPPCISGNALNQMIANASANMLGRTVTVDLPSSILGSIRGDSPLVKTSLGALTASNTMATYHLMGMTTAWNMALGIPRVKDCYEQAVYAHKIGDSEGALLATFGVIREGGLVAGGASYLGIRPLSAFAAVHGSTPLIGRVTFGLGIVGAIAFSIFYLFINIPTAITVFFAEKLQKGLNKCETNDDKIAFLKEQLSISKDEIKDEDCEKEAKAHGAEFIKQIVKQTSGRKLSSEKCQSAFEKFVAKQDIDQVKMGREILTNKIALKKEAKLGRLVGNDCLKEIKAADENTNQAALVAKVGKVMSFNRKFNGFTLAACGFAIVGMIAAVVLSGGIGAIVIAAAMLIIALSQLTLDAYCSIDSYDSASDVPRPHDKKLIVASTIVCLASVITIVALTLTGVLSFGIVPLILTIGLSFVWLGMNGYSLHRINKKEERFIAEFPGKENPTFDSFLTWIKKVQDKEDLKERIDEIMKGLPAEVRTALEEELLNQKNCDESTYQQKLLFAMQHVLSESKQAELNLKKAIANEFLKFVE